MVGPEGATARDEAAAALQRLRDAAGGLFSTITEAQPVAPHHLLTLRAVAEGARTPSDVAAATDRHASSVSRVLDQLVDLDLLSRAADPSDRRQVLLQLTPAGTDVVTTFERLDDALSARMFVGFDDDDARAMAGFLDRLAANAVALAAELEQDPAALGDLH